MARYTGPVCRLYRREGKNLQLKSKRSKAAKRVMDERNVPPGQHGQTRGKLSTYGVQLREKQVAKRIYGVLERQFRRYFARAARYRGVTGHVLLQLLESRLDNVVYRAGFAVTRAWARQLVSHKHVLVNGKRVNIPSCEVKPGDVISVTEEALKFKPVATALEFAAADGRKRWIEFDDKANTAKFLQVPARDEIDDVDIREQLIVELYSK
ncbi:30S ribosomal protein S4 [Candidatus Poribacteria bacterium]|nr:30S ribosomal protein S4 [Candidatus Poribacteria bacterium]